MSAGSTVIDIEAPRLRETAAQQFAQQAFWREQPDLDDTALDLLASAVDEAATDESPGDRFDSQVLAAILRFAQIGPAGDVRCELIPQGKARGRFKLDSSVWSNLKSRQKSIPAPMAHVVTGKIDEIGFSTGHFRLIVSPTDKLLGKVQADLCDREPLRSLGGKSATVEGVVHFKANGKPRLIEARKITPRCVGDSVFEKLPFSGKIRIEDLLVQTADGARDGARTANPFDWMSAWPGDEPIEDLMAQLD